VPEVNDPILIQREVIRRRVRTFKSIGYGLMLLSIICVFICIPTHWPAFLVWTSMISFVASCVILPLPIIFGYAIKAAERDDRKMGIDI
jgi:hypothetical protein